ncbi:MAG: hypothetical protein CMQ41_02140 [Gammaproteobacteria bacterium]|nr:hypothetical protein [Gammaproteobacteria bacterium]
MIITKKALPRRTFVKGVGAALAMPLLESMLPALARAQDTSNPVQRLFVGYVPNGVIMDKWTPTTVGADFAFPSILEPLAKYKDGISVLTGLALHPAMPQPGEGTGDHVRASAAYLTGAHPKKTEGADIQCGVSMDQLAANSIGDSTQMRSLEIALDPNELIGACEAGWSCAYANTLSWRNETTPLPMENQPRAVFERLFGDSDDTSAAAREARLVEERSILDSLLGEVDRLQKILPQHDRQKIDQYLEAIRDAERRIAIAEKQNIELPQMERPAGGIPDTFAEHARLMFDLQLMAFQTDITRVITFMMSREVSPRSYPELGIPDPHHGLSHHQDNPVQMEKLAKLNRHHIEQFAYFMDRLAETPDGNSTLLDNIVMLYGCGISDGNKHLHTDLPCFVAGGGSGTHRGGRHLKFDDDLPISNLQLTMLQNFGVDQEVLGDSTGTISGLFNS